MNKVLDKYKNLPVQARASLWFLFCSFLQKGISLITTPIFTRLLSSGEYGKFGTFNSWYSIIYVIVSLSLASGVYTTAMVKFSDEKRILSSSYQGLTLLLCATWMLVYVLFSDFWNGIFSLTTVQMLAMCILIWTSAAFNLWAVEQRVEYNYKTLVYITVIVSLCKPLLGIFLVVNSKDKVTARILGLAAVELFIYSWVAFFQMKRGGKLFSKKYWLYALKFNVPLIPHTLSQNILSGADRIMIERLVGERQAGYYNLAYTVSSIMLLFNVSLSQTLAPWTYQKLKADKVEDLNDVAVFSIGFVAVINALLILFAPEVIAVFAPAEYAEAAYIIPPVAMSVFFMYLYDWFARFEYYYEKTLYILVASCTGAVLNIALNYAFIPMFGYIAAGYTTFACYLIYCLMHYLFMKRICAKNLSGRNVYNSRQILLISLAFILCGFGILLTYRIAVIRYLCIVLVLIIIYIQRKKVISKLSFVLHLRKQGKKRDKFKQ